MGSLSLILVNFVGVGLLGSSGYERKDMKVV